MEKLCAYRCFYTVIIGVMQRKRLRCLTERGIAG